MPRSDDETDASLDAIADELYALTPDEFTAARNAKAASLDRPLATQVKALRKPATSAWAVSLLARHGDLDEAMELATALREAQDDLDAAELATLGRQRRAVVAALAVRASELARAAGVAVSASARTDIEKTINAAVMDAAAAAAVMTGRLVRPLEAAGFGAVDLTDAVSGSDAVVVSASRDDLAERRARKAAERAAREADRAAGDAERALARIEARLTAARERSDLLQERLDNARAELARIEKDAEKAELETARLEQERTDAASVARSSRREADAAHTMLDPRADDGSDAR